MLEGDFWVRPALNSPHKKSQLISCLHWMIKIILFFVSMSRYKFRDVKVLKHLWKTFSDNMFKTSVVTFWIFSTMFLLSVASLLLEKPHVFIYEQTCHLSSRQCTSSYISGCARIFYFYVHLIRNYEQRIWNLCNQIRFLPAKYLHILLLLNLENIERGIFLHFSIVLHWCFKYLDNFSCSSKYSTTFSSIFFLLCEQHMRGSWTEWYSWWKLKGFTLRSFIS